MTYTKIVEEVPMANEFELKKQFVEIGKRIWTRGYVASNDGNMTVRINDKEILATPTGISKGLMAVEMISKCDMDGNVIAGNPKYRPSSEVKMHLEVYKQRPDVNAVVHAHPAYATSFAVAGIPLDKCVLPEAIIVIGSVPIAPYGLPSTAEIPDRMRPFIKNSDAILLENHGALTLGSDLLNAYHKMETLEHTASIVWKSIQLGNVNVLPTNERDRLLNLRDKIGISGRVIACDTTPLDYESQSNKASCGCAAADTSEVSEKDIKDIVEKVIMKLKNQRD